MKRWCEPLQVGRAAGFVVWCRVQIGLCGSRGPRLCPSDAAPNFMDVILCVAVCNGDSVALNSRGDSVGVIRSSFCFASENPTWGLRRAQPSTPRKSGLPCSGRVTPRASPEIWDSFPFFSNEDSIIFRVRDAQCSESTGF